MPLMIKDREKIRIQPIADLNFDVDHPRDEFRTVIEQIQKLPNKKRCSVTWGDLSEMERHPENVNSIYKALTSLCEWGTFASDDGRENFPILVDEDNTVLDGCHRIASALALGIKEVDTIKLQDAPMNFIKSSLWRSGYSNLIEEERERRRAIN